jgi:CRP-like cAMP-binding protein
VISQMNPLQLLVRRLETHVQLDEADRQAILALPHTVRIIEPQGYILREGDAPILTGILISGFAYRQKLTGDGSRQIVSLQIPGDPLDFQNLYIDEADHNIQALTRAEVALIARGDLQEIARTRAAVGRAMFVLTLVEASIFREWVLNVGRRPAQARVAHVLCELGVRLETQGLTDNYGYQLPMTQEQLADVCGLTRCISTAL